MSRDPGPSNQPERTPDTNTRARRSAAGTPHTGKLIVLLIVVIAVILAPAVGMTVYALPHSLMPALGAGGETFVLAFNTGPQLAKMWFHGP